MLPVISWNEHHGEMLKTKFAENGHAKQYRHDIKTFKQKSCRLHFNLRRSARYTTIFIYHEAILGPFYHWYWFPHFFDLLWNAIEYLSAIEITAFGIEKAKSPGDRHRRNTKCWNIAVKLTALYLNDIPILPLGDEIESPRRQMRAESTQAINVLSPAVNKFEMW